MRGRVHFVYSQAPTLVFSLAIIFLELGFEVAFCGRLGLTTHPGGMGRCLASAGRPFPASRSAGKGLGQLFSSQCLLISAQNPAPLPSRFIARGADFNK